MKPLKFAAFSFILNLLFTLALPAQEINQDQLIRMRDSLDNLLIINPTNSAIIVRHKELEVFSFNSLLNNSNFNDKEGNSTNFEGKQLLFNSVLQLNYGISKNRRVNAGIDVNYRTYRYDADKESSALSVFNSDNTSSFTHAGVRIRLQPFKRVYNFNYQSNIWLPVANETNQKLLGTDKLNWGHTFFYYNYFNNKLGLFTQANLTFAFPGSHSTQEAKTELYVPLSASLSFVANRKNIFFGTLTYSWITTDISKTFEGGDSDFIQLALGYQRILFRSFFLMLNYSATVASRNYGEWNGLNVGMRYLY